MEECIRGFSIEYFGAMMKLSYCKISKMINIDINIFIEDFEGDS